MHVRYRGASLGWTRLDSLGYSRPPPPFHAVTAGRLPFFHALCLVAYGSCLVLSRSTDTNRAGNTRFPFCGRRRSTGHAIHRRVSRSKNPFLRPLLPYPRREKHTAIDARRDAYECPDSIGKTTQTSCMRDSARELCPSVARVLVRWLFERSFYREIKHEFSLWLKVAGFFCVESTLQKA